MTSFQKIIKYGAIGFALYLCFMIISMIIFAITMIFGITTGVDMFNQDSKNVAMITKWEQEYEDIISLDMDLNVCKLTIKKGDKIKVEATEVTENFQCKVEGKELKIKDETKGGWFWKQLDEIAPEVIVYLPETIELSEVKLDTGINETNIEYLKADKVDIQMGVGKYQIQELIANYAKIEAGAGEATIENSQIEELNLEGGVGKLTLTSKISKKADINCGMGRVEVNLLGDSSQYQVKADTGLGNFRVAGKEVQDNQVIGNGNSIIKVEAGVGETIVSFEEEKL